MKDTLLQTVMQGQLDLFRSASVCSPLPSAEYQETNQNILYAFGIDFATCNGVMEKNENRIPTEEEIDRTIEVFSAKKLPFIWWSSAQILENKGFQFGGTLTGIALDISQNIPAKPSSSSHLKVKIVQSEADVRTFTELGANTFGMNASTKEQFLSVNTAVMEQGEQVHFLAYFDEIPVGTASLSTCNSSAGVWNLVTLPEYRKQGVGAALVHACLVEAKNHQYDHVMAILMPKGMAWGLFAKLGFKEACKFPFYVYGVAADKLEK